MVRPLSQKATAAVIRLRVVIVIAWVIALVAAFALLPGLGSQVSSDVQSFLPASSPSVAAASLAGPVFGTTRHTMITIVAWRPHAALTAARAEKVLKAVGLGERLGHLPSELSGGQQQRVAVARARVKEPAVLLADEPTGNLDEETRDGIMDLLETLWRERGLTMVIVTHDSTVAARGQRTGLLRDGRITVTKSSEASRGGGARGASF